MGQASTMLETHPTGLAGVDKQLVSRAIDACYDCAQMCIACADADLAEDTVADMVRDISTDLNCADICLTTGRMLSRPTGFDAVVALRTVEACALACSASAFESERHAQYDHCRACAESARSCEDACRQLLGALA